MELKAQGAPSPKTLCALPGGRPEAWRPARAPSPASQTGKDRRAEGAGPHEMGTARAAIPRSADCPTPARRPLPTVHRTLWTPHPGHNRTMRPPRSRGPRWRPRPRAGVRAPGAHRAPATPFASAPPPRERRFWRRRQSQPLVQRLDQCETRSCEKSPPLARPWPMAGRIFFGRASFLAFRSPLTFACSEPAGSYQAVLSGAARGGGGGGSHGVLFHCV